MKVAAIAKQLAIVTIAIASSAKKWSAAATVVKAAPMTDENRLITRGKNRKQVLLKKS